MAISIEDFNYLRNQFCRGLELDMEFFNSDNNTLLQEQINLLPDDIKGVYEAYFYARKYE